MHYASFNGKFVLCNTKCLTQRGPNPGTRTACGPRTVFVRPANTVCAGHYTNS